MSSELFEIGFRGATVYLAGPAADRRLAGCYGLPREFITAAHEAAHAMTSLRVAQRPVSFVHCVAGGPDGEITILGACHFGEPTPGEPLEERVRQSHAEARKRPGDRRHALACLAMASWPNPSCQQLKSLFRSAEKRAREEVRANWMQIYVIASHLFHRKMLDGAEILAILADAEARGFDASLEVRP